MGNVDGKGIDLPANEHVWESFIQHLLGKKYGRPANAYGSRGHKQNGIDFTVHEHDLRVGIQCKFVSPGNKLDIAKVAADLEASRAIRPPIGRFVLYCSAKSDPKTVDALDELKANTRERGIEFEFHLWRDFEEAVRTYDLFDRINGFEALAPASEPVQGPWQAATRPTQDMGNTSVQSATSIQTVAAVWSTQLLDEVKDLIASGNGAGAMSLVDVVLKRSSQVPSAELARAYTTKAILISRTGRIRDSTEFWRKAAEIEPDPNLQHGRRAQALLSEDRFEEALEAALPGLAVDPPSSLSALAALSAAQRLGRRQEIDSRLSGRLKGERDVGLVRAHVALADGDASLAAELIGVVDEAYPNDADITALRADLLLIKALGGPGKLRAKLITGAESAAVEAALPLYRQSLNKRDPLRDRAGWLPSALNYLSALKLTNRDEEAADWALDITNAFGTDIEDLGRVLLALAEGGKATRALELAEKASCDDFKVALARASALLHLKRFSEAEKVLTDAQVGSTGEDADNISWMLLAARNEARSGADFTGLVKDFYQRANSKLSACSRIIENANGFGFQDLAREYSTRAIELYESEPEPGFLPLIADSLVTLDRHDDAIRLLLPYVDLNSPQGGPVEERLAFCLLHQRRIESLGKLLSGLPTDATDAVRFDPYRIDYQVARGDRPAALAAVRDAMARRAGDLKLQALEVALLRNWDSEKKPKKSCWP